MIVNIDDYQLKYFVPNYREDLVQRVIFESGMPYEERMLDMSRVLLDNMDGYVIDIGAYIGTHTCYWAVVCGMNVLAFEPSSYSYSILEVNVDINNISEKVTAENLALSSAEGRGGIAQLGNGNLGHSILVPGQGDVRIRTLDSWMDEKLDELEVRLIKIDVEGAELSVLEGMSETLEKNNAHLLVELAGDYEYKRVAKYLLRKGYVDVAVFNYTPTYLFVKIANLSDPRVLYVMERSKT